MKPPAVPQTPPGRSKPMAGQAWAKPSMPQGKTATGAPAVPVTRAKRAPDMAKPVFAYSDGGPVGGHRGWGSAKKPGGKK